MLTYTLLQECCHDESAVHLFITMCLQDFRFHKISKKCRAFLSMGLSETAKLLQNVGKQEHTVASQTQNLTTCFLMFRFSYGTIFGWTNISTL